jgi:large subunit ribosomal protein L21
MACGIRCLTAPCTARQATPALARPVAPISYPSLLSQRSRCVRAFAVDEAVITSKPSSSFPTTSDKYAIIDVGGVQHLVEEGRWYTCNRLKASPGDVVSFGRVLAVKDDEVFHVGRPYVEDVTVEAEIIEELKGPKVTIYKMQPKKHTRKTVGHRQPLTKCVSQLAPILQRRPPESQRLAHINSMNSYRLYGCTHRLSMLRPTQCAQSASRTPAEQCSLWQ